MEQGHLEALQLDGVNAECGWTETLECIGHAFWCDDYAGSRTRRERLAAFERNEPKRPIQDVPWTRRAPETLPPHVVSAAEPGEDANSSGSRQVH